MSLSDLASLGSFVSGVAVLASLIFLFFQMRQMTAQVRQAERSQQAIEKNQQSLIQMGRTSRLIDIMYRRLEPRLNDISLRGRRGDTSLAPDQVDAYLTMSYAGLLAFEDTYLQARAGTIYPEVWETTAIARLRQAAVAPGYRVAWKKWKSNFDSGFAEAMDQIIVQARQSTWVERSASWAHDVDEEMRLSAQSERGFQ